MLPYRLFIQAGRIARFGKPLFKSSHLPFPLFQTDRENIHRP